MHRTSHHHSGAQITKLGFRGAAESPHDDGNELFQGIHVGEHVRAFKQTTPQERFDGLHEAPSGVGAEIAANCLWTGYHMRLTIIVFLRMQEVQHRPKGRGDLAIVLKGG